MFFKRILNISEYLVDSSLLLLGPRQTGKTTLIKKEFPDALFFDLLDPELYRDFIKSPNALKDIVKEKHSELIIIDEIQKIPKLLDVVHQIIEEDKEKRFILTGSSARKLKSQKTNLLGGRAYPLYLHPITSKEFLKEREESDLHELLEKGGMPFILNTKNYLRALKAYVGVYLKEEIKAEGFARNLTDFSGFLEVAALTNSEQLNYTTVARDVQLSPRTVSSYYQILQDTMLGYIVPPFKASKSRKTFATPKFYFFDLGVVNYLCGREKISAGTPEYGKILEHFVFCELIAYRDYFEKDFEICYWRSLSNLEVDFVIRMKNRIYYAIEVKSTPHVHQQDLKGIKALEEDIELQGKYVICREKYSKNIDENFHLLTIADFCAQLWAGKLI